MLTSFLQTRDEKSSVGQGGFRAPRRSEIDFRRPRDSVSISRLPSLLLHARGETSPTRGELLDDLVIEFRRTCGGSGFTSDSDQFSAILSATLLRHNQGYRRSNPVTHAFGSLFLSTPKCPGVVSESSQLRYTFYFFLTRENTSQLSLHYKSQSTRLSDAAHELAIS